MEGAVQAGERAAREVHTSWFAFNISIKRLKRIKYSLEGLILCIKVCNCVEAATEKDVNQNLSF